MFRNERIGVATFDPGEALRHSMKFRFTCVQCGRTVVKSPIGLAVLYTCPLKRTSMK